MTENICTNFHDHSTSRSKIIERGRFYPPSGIQKPKKVGVNRVKRKEVTSVDTINGKKGAPNILFARIFSWYFLLTI